LNRLPVQKKPSLRERGSAPAARTYPGLDLIRLVAALMVAMYHFAFFHPLHNHWPTVYQSADWGWCGVQVFFVISGLAIALGSFSALAWLVRTVGFDLPVGPFGHYGCYFAFGMLLFERRSIAFATAFFIAGIVGVYWAAADLGFGFFAPFAWAAATVASRWCSATHGCAGSPERGRRGRWDS
jgi:hypothetical protein